MSGIETGAGPRATLREYLRGGPFALAMSSGFFAFFAHTGFLMVLEDEGLVPSRVSGSSAGALVATAWAAGLDAKPLAGELERLERAHFWDPGPGPGLLRGRLFRDKLEALLPSRAFAACRVPAAVSVFDVRTRRTRVVERGDLACAIHASCAVPLLFHPVSVEGRPSLDGGVLDRPGLAGMPASEPRVLFHHIASKSPWRLTQELPSRRGMVSVVLTGLPRPGPFRLDEGRRALEAARRATRRALDRPLGGGVVIEAA
ncbi:MAG TPA: patatin-like phospholipase family protein [Polyangiaceae bacterium]|nr:patatin-like phospholipase family protein [Polyangiaceae bacterium]